jgi:hypothetical protein
MWLMDSDDLLAEASNASLVFYYKYGVLPAGILLPDGVGEGWVRLGRLWVDNDHRVPAEHIYVVGEVDHEKEVEA